MDGVQSPESTNSDVLAAPDRAWLLHVREELLGPVGNLISLSGMLREETRDLDQPTFRGDLEKIHASARHLFELAEEFLDPGVIDLLTPQGLALIQSRVRHDMLNALNPVVNYSEMWLEDAEGEFLDGFVPDLRKVHILGKQAISVLDKLKAFRPDRERMEEVIDASLIELPPQVPLGKSSDPGHCLVVDDNSLNRDILQRLLEKLGHTVETAIHGRQALEMLQTTTFDLVLLDILMPELNGFQVLTRLKADERLRELPVIMISALDQDDSVVRCIALGAEDYLPRPFNPLLLKARIGACLEKKRLRDREKLHLAEIEKQRRRSDELLHVILPGPIVEELKKTDEVKPRRYDNVAVLFADLVGFTPYCDQHRPEEVVEHLQRLVAGWETVALVYGVEKIKTIGDAFMAASGLLVEVDNPVLACVRCGLEMIRQTRALGWDLRVGVHVGQVVAGVIGRRQYLFDLWGDTVNTAARMESHGVAGTITLTEEAWRWVQNHGWGRRHAVEVKGKGRSPVVRLEELWPPARSGGRA